ncbi:hypothetical protein V6N13_131487 [Hibiscus sabdariffa]
MKATGVIPAKGLSTWAEDVDKRMNARSSNGDNNQCELEIDKVQKYAELQEIKVAVELFIEAFWIRKALWLLILMPTWYSLDKQGLEVVRLLILVSLSSAFSA